MRHRDALLRRHRAGIAADQVKEVYSRRQQLVEPIFGIAKEQQRVEMSMFRGLMYVSAEWAVLATAFNLRSLWKAWRRGAFTSLAGGPQPQPTSWNPAVSAKLH